VPGIDVTDDPLMQARLFSYLDTQITRLGGPNFAELPINRPLVPVHNNQHDGFGRQSIPTSEANYHPNSLGGGFPKPAAGMASAFAHVRERIDGSKLRARSDSFADHFSQATLFLASLTPPERRHLTGALQFELGKVERLEVRQRVVDAILAPIDVALAREVAAAIGAKPPAAAPAAAGGAGRPRRSALARSPALSMAPTGAGGIATRTVAALVADGFAAADLETVKAALEAAGAVLELVAPTLGPVTADDGTSLTAPKSLLTTGSIRYDAVFVPGGAASLATLAARPEALRFVEDAYRHCKTIAVGEGAEDLLAPARQRHGLGEGADAGIVSGRVDRRLAAAFVEQIAQHRHWAREG
jgi:catalase